MDLVWMTEGALSSNVSNYGVSVGRFKYSPPTTLVAKARNMRPTVSTVARNFMLAQSEQEQSSDFEMGWMREAEEETWDLESVNEANFDSSWVCTWSVKKKRRISGWEKGYKSTTQCPGNRV